MAGPHAGETKTAWDDAPDGLALVDARGRFVQVNLAGARLFGQGRDRHRGHCGAFRPGVHGQYRPGRAVRGRVERTGDEVGGPGVRLPHAATVGLMAVSCCR
ncbi:PAS domain-containing protein [Amycolatopsis sp.]|uniref:PAS domain-containing protein n=1 Tax=Amycolatopsis sp. TaxID=37632 RepID=UPI00345A8A8C